jgi:putative ABC transport system substrate-binding protein
LSYVHRQLIVDFAAKHRLPAIYQATAFAAAGGLMTWAPDLVDQFRTAAGYVDQILKGANPGDLPIRYPARYYLTLNNTAARNTNDAVRTSVTARIATGRFSVAFS